MRCKPGDLAVVVRSSCGNEGRVVKCLRLDRGKRMLCRNGSIYVGPLWEIDPPLTTWAGNLTSYARDDQLRPLRDNDGEDEMLRIAGLPQPTEHGLTVIEHFEEKQ